MTSRDTWDSGVRARRDLCRKASSARRARSRATQRGAADGGGYGTDPPAGSYAAHPIRPCAARWRGSSRPVARHCPNEPADCVRPRCEHSRPAAREPLHCPIRGCAHAVGLRRSDDLMPTAVHRFAGASCGCHHPVMPSRGTPRPDGFPRRQPVLGRDDARIRAVSLGGLRRDPARRYRGASSPATCEQIQGARA